MFTKVQIKLTLLYSLLFLSLFWAFSFSLYFWMTKSFGEDYISQVKERHSQLGDTDDFEDVKTTVVTVAGDIALEQLFALLLVINGVSLLVVPTTSWFLVKKSLEPIKVAHEKQKQFVSDASHELRTPLAIIKGETEVALKKTRTIKEYKNILKSSNEEMVRLSTLVENLLFLARENPKNNINFSENVDLTDLISNIVFRLNPYIKEKNLKVTLKSPSENLVTRGNKQLLGQLFYNLTDNAIKYTPVKGNITLDMVRDRNWAKISVRDTGMGIGANNKSNIFDRFYRVENSRSVIKGYGLGLSICQSIVNYHSGKIFVKSRLNKGSEFIVLLPI